MVAVSRWNEYDVNATTGRTASLTGKRAYSRAENADSTDAFTITPTTNNLRVNIGGEARTITIASGTELDPRFIALDIQRKLQDQYAFVSTPDNFHFAQCEFLNGHFIIYSGDTGSGASVAVEAAASNDARATLGFDSTTDVAGANGSNGYSGVVTVTGTYTGQFDDIYTVIATNNSTAGSVSITGGSFSLGASGMTVGGDWNKNQSKTYTIHVDTTNGSTMGAGTGNVPTFTVETSDHTDDVATAVELLYPDHWYNAGVDGFRIKFGEGVFDGTGNGGVVDFAFATGAVSTVAPAQSTAPVGTAQVIVRSARGDDMAPQTTSQTPIAIGTQGIAMAWAATDNIDALDYWRVIARSIRPTSGDAGITTVNYGNVTVSTDSAVKVVQFEIMSGAVIMDSLKFGLNNRGGFQHHEAGDNDTFVHFATVGAANKDDSDNEWNSGITATDLSTDKTGGNTGSPEELYAVVKNLSVVSSADDSEVVGNTGLNSDYIFLGIKLGASETSANTVTYRIFYDFS